MLPALQRLGVAGAKPRERRDRAFDIGPPFERVAVARQQRDVELRFDVARAVPLEIEVGVPRHRGDRALEEGMRVVQKARIARILDGREPAAGDRAAIDRKRLQPGLAEIGLQDEAVVARADDDAVVVVIALYSMPSRR